MGFWRDIGSALGACDEYSRAERKEAQQIRANRLTGHRLGCGCHWCQCASDNPKDTYKPIKYP